MYRHKNHIITLGFEKVSAEIQSDVDIEHKTNSALLITDAISVLRPGLLNRSKGFQSWIVASQWFITLIGSYFRFILYEYIYDQYKKKKSTPIDLLILISSIIQHTAALISAIVITSVVVTGKGLDEWIEGGFFCTALRKLIIFDLVYSIVGSFGMSIYRILYIKMESWVKYAIGETTLLIIVILGGFVISLSPFVIRSLTDVPEYTNECYFTGHWSMHQILMDYYKSNPNTAVLSYHKSAMIYGILFMVMTVAEISMYIYFFYFLFTHDNSERLRLALDPSVIQNRNRNNAITFFSQFCSFVLEFTLTFFVIHDSMNGPINGTAPFVNALLMRKIIFASMSVVEVLTSSSLRSILFKRWRNRSMQTTSNNK